MSIDMALWLMCIAGEAAVVVLLFYRRIFRLLPMFFSWVLWTVLSDIAAVLITRHFQSHSVYVKVYVIEFPLDSLLQFGVLVELAWSVLRPFRASLPRWTIFAIAASIAIAGAIIWPFASIPRFATLPPQWHFLVRLQQTCSILRVLTFLLMAACSQLLAIGWRNRELQVATGLGFYSLVSLAAEVLHKHQLGDMRYHHVDQAVIISYICSLAYWVVSFAQKEAVRQKFSPKMQSFLLSVTRSTRTARMALADSPPPDSQRGHNP